MACFAFDLTKRQTFSRMEALSFNSVEMSTPREVTFNQSASDFSKVYSQP